MGAFVAACSLQDTTARDDACCYEEWVRPQPDQRHTIPRASLIKGRKLTAMLDRVFEDVNMEELSRSLYLRERRLQAGSLTVDRCGSLAEAVARASRCR